MSGSNIKTYIFLLQNRIRHTLTYKITIVIDIRHEGMSKNVIPMVCRHCMFYAKVTGDIPYVIINSFKIKISECIFLKQNEESN